jgi:ABC-type multidrug transport system fused ATPase/permease subunit
LSSVSANVSLFFISLGPVIVFVMGGNQLLAGSMSIGALVAFIQYLNRVYTPMNDLILLYTDYVKASVSMKRIGPFLFEPPIQSNRETQFKTVNSITLRNLNFSYHEHIPLLNDVNFEFVRGKSYAIVGSSGSGKSSLLNLLTKFYLPPSGQVLINNDTDINNISPSAWNNLLTSCHQDALILNESIADNLRYGNQTATDQQLKLALAEVNFLDLIGDGAGSVVLSGGQQQQLALARTILKQSAVLTLDESTSSLDSINDHFALSRIVKSNTDRIIICVSHRLSTIRYFDDILVLRDGRIVESGSPDTLLSKQGIFCEIFENQIGKMEKQSPISVIN